MTTVSLWRHGSECATEATAVEDQCGDSVMRQARGRGDSGPLRHELRVFGGYSGVDERMFCEQDFQVENVPVNSQSNHSWLAIRKRPETSSVEALKARCRREDERLYQAVRQTRI